MAHVCLIYAQIPPLPQACHQFKPDFVTNPPLLGSFLEISRGNNSTCMTIHPHVDVPKEAGDKHPHIPKLSIMVEKVFSRVLEMVLQTCRFCGFVVLSCWSHHLSPDRDSAAMEIVTDQALSHSPDPVHGAPEKCLCQGDSSIPGAQSCSL